MNFRWLMGGVLCLAFSASWVGCLWSGGAHATTGPADSSTASNVAANRAAEGQEADSAAAQLSEDDSPSTDKTIALASAEESQANPLDAQRAYEYLKQICELGPRPTGSPGMEAQRKLVADHFTSLGGNVSWQEFTIRDPRSAAPVEVANMLVEWHPERKDRILLVAHYDTLPLPLAERNPHRREHGIFIGANDGASGVALLMELAHQMADLQSHYGVDFLLVDAEELVYDESRARRFIGSEYFARNHVANPPSHRYRWGVVVDMIGDRQLNIHQERHSVWWDDTRPLVEQIWGTARRLGVREFIARPKYEVQDDHLMLRNIGKIPTCNLIDFDYPAGPAGAFWHTEADTPDKCSGESLAKVGWVLLEWIRSAN